MRDKLLERMDLVCYWILIATKSLIDFLTDSETKRRYYKRYWKKMLERKA